MTRVTARATGPVDPATVWERYADTRLWATWSPQVRGVELAGDGHRLRAGSRGQVLGPLGLRIPFSVDDLDEAAMTWTWKVAVGRLTACLGHTVLAAARGTTTTLTIDTVAPIAVGYSVVAQLALHRLVHRRPGAMERGLMES